MITERFQFLSADNKTRIAAWCWMPDSRVCKGIIQLTHGMVEYIERYTDFAGFLTEHGYMVAGHDHLGHGDSVRTQEDWGYFEKNDPSGTLVTDMHTLRRKMQKDHPELPYFMFGHSMGSYLLRRYLAEHGEGLAGAILCGTGYMPAATTGMGLTLVALLTRLRGDRCRSRFVQSMTYDKPYKKFDLTGKDLSNSWLTRDTAIVEKYYKDPKCTFLFTLNGYRGLIETVRYVCRQENIDRVPDDVPILIISGSDDPVGGLGEGVKTVAAMFKKSGRKDVTMKLYDGYRHEILNEIGRESVYQDVVTWIESERSVNKS